ncbi:acyltransferase family protein [Rhizobium sp. 'Codium 1']|uniref:acyltransferase family protein n=1 Tax=Rhizobium sp. 'Codium 1' TaxID=2940484 RepID=UPI001E4893A3|nr:acyltransferase [Rhizobium sp. 'Codium 1']MCC8934857.1 acyltransferase [Rhizobium sp. 'Codium 1']
MCVQLQYIRAIAALLVVYFHAILQLENLNPDAPITDGLFGKSGVDLFFVLSGFVMWITTSDKPQSVADFWWKRVRRVVPLYWAVTLAAAFVALIVPQILRTTQFDVPHILASLAFLPWLHPADPAGEMIAPLIVPGWTLNYEMYFYLLFGLCLLVPVRHRIVAVTALIGGVFLVANLVPESTAARFYGDTVIFEFVAGMVLGRIYKAGVHIAAPVVAVGVALGFGVLVFNDYNDFDLPRLITIGMPAALIIFFSTAIRIPDLKAWRWLRLLGDASYSIYLTHIFTLAGSRMIYPWVIGTLQSDTLFVVLMMAMSTAVGLASYFLFEVPVGRILSSGNLPRFVRPAKVRNV